MKRLPGDLLGYFIGAARAGLNAQNGQQHYVMVMKPPRYNVLHSHP